MDFTKLDAYTEEMQERYAIPAYDLAVSVDGREVFRKMDGYADGAKTRPVSDKDMYICFSASKVLTGAALARLLAEKKISLDDEAGKYLPSFRNVQVAVRDENGQITGTRKPVRPVLIRHLATMTAGMTYNLYTPYIRKALRDGRRTTLELVDAMAEEPLSFDPGDSYQYSLCLDALAGVVEVVTEQRFSDYIRTNFCEPLGITDLTYHMTPGQKERLTAQYVFRGRAEDGTYRYEETEKSNGFMVSEQFDSGGAGVFATVSDYMKFAEALACGGVGANGVRICPPETMAWMRAPMLTPIQKKAFDTLGKYGCSYGLGVRTTVEPEKFGFCTPVGEFGWDGAAAAYVTICPEYRTAMYFGTQVLDFGEAFGVIHHKLRECVYEALGCPAQHKKP